MTRDATAGRLRSAMARHGAKGLAVSAARKGLRRVRLREAHVWSELRVAAALQGAELDPPLALTRPPYAQLDLVEQVGQSADSARARHADGHEQWLVLDGSTVAFACWIFRGRAPVAAHADGWLPLPAGTVCLEDSVTAPTHRGRGIAPRAWTLLAAMLHEEGVASMITKIEVENVPSRKAVGKAGFKEVAVQRFERLGRRERVTVEVLDGAPMGAALRDALAR